MIVDGATYQEVADKFGVSKQYIHQTVNGFWESKYSARKSKCIYPNIHAWLKRNRMSQIELARKIGVKQGHIWRLLSGTTRLTKDRIDQILEITGMSYEEAFKTEK